MTSRVRLVARGAVQGVGFRPFAYRLATELGLAGYVRNDASGVVLELEGPDASLEDFRRRLGSELPPAAFLHSVEATHLDPAGHDGFRILESAEGGAPTAIVLPDLATCTDCLREVLDPADRRHRYPFANCTNCGPRYTILEKLPYDRPHTSMRRFAWCADCRREYDDPRDRRFHAQPIACPACGPQLALHDAAGAPLAERDAALRAAAAALCEGRIVAVLGLGGFHLCCDARDDRAVRTLRERKHREEKPLAVLFATRGDVERACEVSPAEARLLESPQAPIVLLRRRSGGGNVAPSVAPGNPFLGAMLPSTPLHHLLLRETGRPLVATSGNLSDEPLCTVPAEAFVRLAGIADLFLVHDRPVMRHVDDSVVRVVLGRELVLRRARGYAPLPVPALLPEGAARRVVLAVGGQQKNTVALAVNGNVVLSQHVGDLETAEALAAFRAVIASLEELHEARPAVVAADLHPDYASTRHALATGLPVRQFQHHHAHVAACMAENELEGRVLGVSWDGTGFGADGTAWGGELLLAEGSGFRRFASLLPFRLPGGDRAAREPRRAALGVLRALRGPGLPGCEELPPLRDFAPAELALVLAAMERGVNSPATSSAGRLFDAVASLSGLRQRCGFEGQAAMELEWACGEETGDGWPFDLAPGPGGPQGPELVADWRPALEALLDERARGVAAALLASRFHDTLARLIVEVARRSGEERVVLTGGCFQNRVLTERAVSRLRAAGLKPSWHQRVPPNDGGLALGQAVLALRAAG